MKRAFLLPIAFYSAASAAFDLSIDSANLNVEPVFSNVDLFTFLIEFNGDLAVGSYSEVDQLSMVDYLVNGSLVAGTPSGFPAFNLMRTITAEDFFAQGSSYSFEIAELADLSDGLQADELVPDSEGVIFTFNGREIDNGRFHPALFVMNIDGTGSIRNSNNIHTLEPLLELDFGDEYITNFTYDPGNLTLAAAPPSDPDPVDPDPVDPDPVDPDPVDPDPVDPDPVDPDPVDPDPVVDQNDDDDGGIGSLTPTVLFLLMLAAFRRRMRK